jgi:hypothetical protein
VAVRRIAMVLVGLLGALVVSVPAGADPAAPSGDAASIDAAAASAFLEAHRPEREPSEAAPPSDGAAQAAASTCAGGSAPFQSFDDAHDDVRTAVDLVRTTAQVDCSDGSFRFAFDIRGPSQSQLDVVVVDMDLDARFGNGCHGVDRILITAVDALGPYAVVVATPSCDDATWVDLAPAHAYVAAGLLTVRLDRFQPTAPFTWASYLYDRSGALDDGTSYGLVFDGFEAARAVPVPLPPAPSPGATGYWMLGQGGRVHEFGAARFLGEPRLPAALGQPTWDIASMPDGAGYMVLTPVGVVRGYGTAAHLAVTSMPLALERGDVASTISITPSGEGYWVFTALGHVFSFGDAEYYGSTAFVDLNGYIVDSVATVSGEGYYLVGSDGGVFCFGDASFHGSTGAMRLNQPISGIAPDPDGSGYWLVAYDGGVFAFDAPFLGSMGGIALQEPVIGVVAFGSDGYLMVARDGGIFTFGNVPFHGSLGANRPTYAIIAVAPLAVPAA